MSLDYQTSTNVRWFLDSRFTLSSAQLSDMAQAICEEPGQNDVLSLGPLIDNLPDAVAVKAAWHTFEERVALLVPHFDRYSAQGTAKLLKFSQSVNGALRERLGACTQAEGDSTNAVMQTRLGHLTAIQQVNNVANSTLDLEQLMDSTVKAVSEVLQLDDCSIYLFDESLNRLTLRATTGLSSDAVGRVHLNLGEGVTGWAAQHGEPVALENAWEDPRFVYLPELKEDAFRSMLSVPVILFTVNKLIGVLNLQNREPRHFSSEEVAFVETVCGQIAIAIDNARLYIQIDEKLSEKVSQLSTLQGVWASIASSLDLSQVLEMIARHAAELSSADKAAIFKVDEKDHDLFIIADYNLSEQCKTMRVKVGDGAIGLSVSNRAPERVEDTFNDPTLAAIHPQIVAEGIRSLFCVPLIARDQVLGGISVFTMERHEFSEEQIQLVSTFAYDAALAIENARLYQEAQRALETQAILMREMQHRVKNNLQTVASLLSLQMRRAESPEAASLLGLSAARVESIAAVHELFSEEDIGLATVGEIADRIMEIVLKDIVPPSQRIDFTIAPAPIKLGSEQATLFALVLNELVSNAIMHGLAGLPSGSIRITATQDNGTIAVDVWDGGKGIPADFSLQTQAGLGLSIVEQLVTHELSGTFQLENEPSGGTKAHITFPAKPVDFWTVWWKG